MTVALFRGAENLEWKEMKADEVEREESSFKDSWKIDGFFVSQKKKGG